jgi:hypothetical protein
MPVLTKTGAATNIVDKYTNNPLWNLEGNGIFIQFGSAVHFYFSDQYNVSGHVRIATDADAATWGTPQTVIASNGSWWTACKDPDTGIIYALGTSSPGNDGDVYAFKSSDGLTFTAINNGNPVLSQPADANSVWYHRWNTKLVIVDGIFHLWMDTAYSGSLGPIGGAVPSLGITLNWGQAYSFASLGVGDTLNFEPNKTTTWAIPQGNALEAIYIPERNAIFFIDAHFPDPNQLDGHNGLYSHIRALSASAYADLSDWANYTELDFGIEGEWYPDLVNRRSVSDPGINTITGKTSAAIFAYNYDQENQNVEYSDLTLLELYDASGGVSYPAAAVTTYTLNRIIDMAGNEYTIKDSAGNDIFPLE